MSRTTRYIKLYKVLIIFVTLFKAYYQDKVTLTKCCSDGFHVWNTSCVSNVIGNSNCSDVHISTVDEESHVIESGRKFHEVFRLELSNASLVPNTLLEKLFPTGDLLSDNDFIEASRFCVDYIETSNESYVPRFWLTQSIEEEAARPKINYFSVCALITSCISLSLVILVHILIPELRTRKGKILLSCVGSLLGTFLTLATMQITVSIPNSSTLLFCYAFTALVYFFSLASFFWMNVLAFTMWRDNRQILQQIAKISYYRNIVSDRRDNRIFRNYCLYAWGIPFVLTIFLIVIDRVNLEHVPWFIKPGIIHNGCFLSGKERLLYLYLPMMIILVSNWIFVILTAFNLWGTFNDTNILAQKRQSLKNRLIMFLKLSILMGVSWVLEVLSSVLPTNTLEPMLFIFDLYNAFIGVAFFIVLVRKKRIWVKIFRKREQNSNGGRSMRLNTMSSIRI